MFLAYFAFFILVLNINWHGVNAWLIYSIMQKIWRKVFRENNTSLLRQ
jgi:hypothetical protein